MNSQSTCGQQQPYNLYTKKVCVRIKTSPFSLLAGNKLKSCKFHLALIYMYVIMVGETKILTLSKDKSIEKKNSI